MADADTLQTRKAHTTHNSHPDDGSTSVPIVESNSGADQYPNPFQQHVGQAHGRNHQQQQQHYNVMIPTIDHWPAIFLDGLKTSAQLAVLGLKQAHTKWQEYQSSRGGSYQVLPTTIDSLSQQNTPTRQMFTFGSKRQQKGGHQFSVSGRRLTRLLFLLVLAVTTILLLVLPHRLNPLEDRAIWIRYYSHEEAIKIMVPYGIKLHVSDVKKAALKEMHQGFSTFGPAGTVKLISKGSGALAPDRVWNNRDWEFESSARHPILIVDTKYELFRFLESSLHCFAPQREYAQQRRDQFMVSFNPEHNDYATLARIINNIANDQKYFEEYEIFYLRNAFDDPRKNDPRTGQRWKKSSGSRDIYTLPDVGYIPHQPTRPVWSDIMEDSDIIPRSNSGNYESQGVVRDFVKAKDWFLRASDRLPRSGTAYGDPKALAIGNMYYRGGRGLQDYTKAMESYLRVAEQRHEETQFSIGHMFYFGHGVHQDYNEAYEWWLKAADQGYPRAQARVGLGGAQVDQAKALEMYRKDAEQKYAGAQLRIGVFYAKGRGSVVQSYM
ncbi:hypothetical protein BGX30_007367 [Mortierella sp. GBA39]|nr:hypothetical protein BGX30_007367 [Mortierella sp. GBA39]